MWGATSDWDGNPIILRLTYSCHLYAWNQCAAYVYHTYISFIPNMHPFLMRWFQFFLVSTVFFVRIDFVWFCAMAWHLALSPWLCHREGLKLGLAFLSFFRLHNMYLLCMDDFHGGPPGIYRESTNRQLLAQDHMDSQSIARDGEQQRPFVAEFFWPSKPCSSWVCACLTNELRRLRDHWRVTGSQYSTTST